MRVTMFNSFSPKNTVGTFKQLLSTIEWVNNRPIITCMLYLWIHSIKWSNFSRNYRPTSAKFCFFKQHYPYMLMHEVAMIYFRFVSEPFLTLKWTILITDALLFSSKINHITVIDRSLKIKSLVWRYVFVDA